MKQVRAAAALLALGTALVASPALSGDRGWSRHGDDRQYLYLGNQRLFSHDRLSRHKGFFDHGSTSGDGRYNYDRGYPYDHYDDGGWDDAEDYVEETPRHLRCTEQWVRDHRGRKDVAVNICRG